MKAAIALAALGLSAPAVFAQAPMVIGATTANVIHAGTPVQLETRDLLSTDHKALKVGQQVEMDVVQPVMLNDHVVIPAGSRAVGEITSVRNKGMWGKSGGIVARVLYVEANGQQLALNGTFDSRGETGSAGVIASVAFVPVAGFFVTGTSAKIAPGTHVTARLANDLAVQFASETATGAQAPLMATSVAPVAAAAAVGKH